MGNGSVNLIGASREPSLVVRHLWNFLIYRYWEGSLSMVIVILRAFVESLLEPQAKLLIQLQSKPRIVA